MPQLYQGFYACFDTFSKKVSGALEGADTIVGDELKLSFSEVNGTQAAVISNKFGAELGYFNVDDTRKIKLLIAREWNVTALLSLVAYSNEPEPGHYWGEVCVIGYHPSIANAVDTFLTGIGEMLAGGIRPQIDLSESGVQTVIDTNGNWKPNDRVPLPQKKEKMAIIKSKRTFSEKMVEDGRDRKIGCYIITYAFFALIVVLIIWIIHLLGVF